MSEPTTVSFTIEPGEVWVAPDNVAWYVKWVDTRGVHLERTVVESVSDVHEFVRTWRKLGEEKLP